MWILKKYKFNVFWLEYTFVSPKLKYIKIKIYNNNFEIQITIFYNLLHQSLRNVEKKYEKNLYSLELALKILCDIWNNVFSLVFYICNKKIKL